ncbi:hypothetical protein D6D13_07566 [Aureobasidium pullulans]|uniref:Uncharacterized protein n=1 Tax=Aureobasidium pullulans TaxID=5580 RepID=A0A4V4IZ53_AURPU|nr:hypothetical protein D6D13_07566 [Aureobasidium pullulans]
MEDNTYGQVDEVDESGGHEGVHQYQYARQFMINLTKRIIHPIAVLLGILIKTSTKAPSDPSIPIFNRCFFNKCPSEIVDEFYFHLSDKRDMLALLMSGNKQHVNSGKQAIWSRCTPKGYDTLLSLPESTVEYNAMVHHLDLETKPVLPELNHLKTLSLLIRPGGADKDTFRSIMGLPHLRKLTLPGCFDIGELHDHLYDDLYDSPPLFPVMDYMYLIGDSTPLPCESPREIRITCSRVRVIAAQLIAIAPGLKHFNGLFVAGDVSISFSKLDGKTRCQCRHVHDFRKYEFLL